MLKSAKCVYNETYMELVKSAGKKTSRLSEILYIAFNIILAVGVFLAIYYGVPTVAYSLIIISKWRVFAVRPRFWWVNIKANSLDLLLGLSVATMILQATNVLWLQILLTVLYGLWLIILKPRSGSVAILLQAGIAQFMAITALYSVSYDWSAWVVVIAMAMIGYISAQHALSSFEGETTILSSAWALIVAELGWLAYSWTIAYSVAPAGVFKIPQISVIITLVGYFAVTAYKIYDSKNKLRPGDVTLAAMFASGIILTILIFFNDIIQG